MFNLPDSTSVFKNCLTAVRTSASLPRDVKYFALEATSIPSSIPFMKSFTLGSLVDFSSFFINGLTSFSKVLIPSFGLNGSMSPSFFTSLPTLGFLTLLKTFSICFLNNGVTSPNSFFANLRAWSIFLIAPDCTNLYSTSKNFPISNMSFVFWVVLRLYNLQRVIKTRLDEIA